MIWRLCGSLSDFTFKPTQTSYALDRFHDQLSSIHVDVDYPQEWLTIGPTFLPSFPSPLPPRSLLPFLLTKCVTRCVLLCEQARARASSEGPKRTRGRVCARDAQASALLSIPALPSLVRLSSFSCRFRPRETGVSAASRLQAPPPPPPLLDIC